MLDKRTLETLLEEAATLFNHDIGHLMHAAHEQDAGKQLGTLMAGLAERQVYEWFLDRLQKGLGTMLEIEQEESVTVDPPTRLSADQYVQ